MIVIDTNVLVNLALDDEGTSLPQRWAIVDSDWRLPFLWRYEFANAMVELVKHEDISPDFAERKILAFTERFQIKEHEVSQLNAFRAARKYRLSIYDANFVVLAQQLGTHCVTNDTLMLERAAPLTRNFRFPPD